MAWNNRLRAYLGRREGRSYAEIAAVLGYDSPERARDAVYRLRRGARLEVLHNHPVMQDFQGGHADAGAARLPD